MPVEQELGVALTPIPTTVAPLSTLDKDWVGNVTLSNGLSLPKALTGTTGCSKINVNRLIVGSLTIFQAHTSALTQITKSSSALDLRTYPTTTRMKKLSKLQHKSI